MADDAHDGVGLDGGPDPSQVSAAGPNDDLCDSARRIAQPGRSLWREALVVMLVTVQHEIDVTRHQLMRNRVEVFSGEASFVDPHTIRLTFVDKSGQRDVTAENIVIAVGSRPGTDRTLEYDGRHVLQSDDILGLEKLLDRVADDDKKLADFIRAQAIAHIDEIKAEAVKEYEGLWFYLKDEDGEAQVTVDEARFEGEVEVLELGDGEATVVVSFLLEYTAEASFADPDMQSYDSETGETFSWGTKEETVHRRGRARVELSVWFEGLDPGSVQIKNVRLVEPSESVGIDVYDPRDFK